MRRYEVDFYDYNNGATEAIDTITAALDYTAEQYIEDCRHNADAEWCELFDHGVITLHPVNDYQLETANGEWDMDEAARLCEDAELSEEWNSADGETFEQVIYKAAEILGVSI